MAQILSALSNRQGKPGNFWHSEGVEAHQNLTPAHPTDTTSADHLREKTLSHLLVMADPPFLICETENVEPRPAYHTSYTGERKNWGWRGDSVAKIFAADECSACL